MVNSNNAGAEFLLPILAQRQMLFIQVNFKEISFKQR